MHPSPPRRRRARPVADAPIDALLARAEDIAKGWMLALLEQAPLDDAPGILAAELARDGPRVCAAVVRALAAEEDLRRLEPGGALEELASRAGELAGALSGDAASAAVDALSAVMWSAIRTELRDPDPDQISELAERLAAVIERVRGAVLRRAAAGSHRLRVAPAQQGPGGGPQRGEAVGEVVRVDRLRPADPPPDSPDSAGSMGSTGSPDSPDSAGSTGSTGSPDSPDSAGSTGSTGSPDSPDSLWLEALDAEVARSERSGAPLSLLLIELDDADRIVAVESPGEVAATFERFAQAVRSVLRREDTLACESDTRAWIIARDTGRRGAWSLGARVAGAVKAAPPWRGAPLSVSVGLAVLGENGRDSSALVRAAEQTKFAAAASGIGIDGEARNGAEVDEPAS